MTGPPSQRRPSHEFERQGIKQLYPIGDGTNGDKATNVDVVFVPDFGTRPEQTWQGPNSSFNWAFDKNGLPKDYPKARVLLYQYNSIYRGPSRNDQFLHAIAIGLLESLQVHREDQIIRPLVFIGHSIGGLIIAKAVNLMDSRRDVYPKLFEATAGCIFFGSPFLGFSGISIDAMSTVIGSSSPDSTLPKLLEFAQPYNESLRELRTEFRRLITKVSPNIEIHCFWEEVETDETELAAAWFGILQATELSLIPDAIQNPFFSLAHQVNRRFKMVEHESAIFEGTDNSGLLANHTNLVKFNDSKDSRFQLMRGPLKRILHNASRNARHRINSVRDLDLEAMRNITKTLGGGISVQARRKSIEEKFIASSWLPTEREFVEWLSAPEPKNGHAPWNHRRGDCLYICGAEGRGKTGTSLAAIKNIEEVVEHHNRIDSGEPPYILVYFFCDTSSDFGMVENLLKSIVWQLTQEQPLFNIHAKQFNGRDGRQPAGTSIENLWQSLQNMFSDRTASSRIYIVINNLHCLSGDSESTAKLTKLIKGDIEMMNDTSIVRTSVRWLVTNRKTKRAIDLHLGSEDVRLIDLEADKYEDKVRLELRKYTQTKVSLLAAQKNYNKDLAYFVSSLIGHRAKSTSWIDIICSQLAELDETRDRLTVRRILKALPQKLDDLLDAGWKKIFKSNPNQEEALTEMLKTLVLTYEDPSLEELAILAGFGSDDLGVTQVSELVELCASFLTISPHLNKDGKVCFKSDIVKPHLLQHADEVLGWSAEETRWHQGEMALRSFAHLIERYTLPEDKGTSESQMQEEDEDKPVRRREVDSSQFIIITSRSGNDLAKARTATNPIHSDEELEATALPYMVKYWLRHASAATPEMTEDLSREEQFWKPKSPLLRRWLTQHNSLTGSLTVFGAIHLPFDSWNALHVAASVGYHRLVSALIKNGHKSKMDDYDRWCNAPLHIAAFFGRAKIVQELLGQGAYFDEGKEGGHDTPLAMAAAKGNLEVMNILLDEGADINAFSTMIGVPLNSAIILGNIDAVKLLVDKGAKISHANEHPLGYSAILTDHTIFNYLLEAGKDELQTPDLDGAFNIAASAGNVYALQKLLRYGRSYDVVQEALKNASKEKEWGIVKIILSHYEEISCDDLFIEVAAATGDLDELIDTIWKYAKGSISERALNKALYNATDNEKESTVSKLLALGASPNATGEEYGNALTAAAYDGTINLVRMLLDAGCEIREGWALQTAAGGGHSEIVKLLLERGADINACSTDPRFPQGTALQAAVEAGHGDIVSLLLDSGADPNLGAGEFVCPIIAASSKAEGEMLKRLIEAGANVNAMGGTRYSTPLINTASFLSHNYLKMLLDAGAEANLTDVNDNSALIEAAAVGDKLAVEILLDHGADVRHKSALNGTALQAAFRNGNRDCLELLIDHVSNLLIGGVRKVNVVSDHGDLEKVERAAEDLGSP